MLRNKIQGRSWLVFNFGEVSCGGHGSDSSSRVRLVCLETCPSNGRYLGQDGALHLFTVNKTRHVGVAVENSTSHMPSTSVKRNEKCTRLPTPAHNMASSIVFHNEHYVTISSQRTRPPRHFTHVTTTNCRGMFESAAVIAAQVTLAPLFLFQLHVDSAGAKRPHLALSF